jgi:predicted acylesterase/phospholipase RssA
MSEPTPTTSAVGERNLKPEDHAIGLCFSGGGFRASFYCLGILRYLAEAGLLPHLTCISAVSGGSIAAAAVGDRWQTFQQAGGDHQAFQTHIDGPFRTTITKKNLRRRWMLASLAAIIPRTGGRGGALARTLAHNIYTHKQLVELPHQPEIILTATDLSKGHAFRAAAGYLGSWNYGYIEPTPDSIRLAQAVAASAAFPPSLTIINLSTRQLRFPKSQPPEKLSLVDGGVYDNLGLEWIQGWQPDSLRPKSANKPTFTIVANASGILEDRDKKFSPWSAVLRELAIQYQQVLSLRARWQHDTRKDNPDIYMAIKDDPRSEHVNPVLTSGALPSALIRPLALLRTDLDRFGRTEADLLSYHAYWTLHARLGTYAPELAIPQPSWTEYAGLSPDRTDQLRLLLELGSHRFFRRTRRLLQRLHHR